MNWIGIGLTVLSAGLAAGIALFIVRRPKEKCIAFTVTGVVAFTLLDGLALQFLAPRLNAWNSAHKIASALEQIPAFQAIRQHEPEIYDGIVADLTKATDGGAGDAQIVSLVRGHIAELIKKRLPRASDEAAVSYIKVMLAEMNELNQRGGDLCYRFLFPQRSEAIDGRKYFSAETQAADLAALAEVIRTANQNPRPIPSEQEVAPALKSIYTELGKEHGNDLLMLQSPVASDADKAKVCSMAMSLYSKILRLPEAESGKILRFMLSRS